MLRARPEQPGRLLPGCWWLCFALCGVGSVRSLEMTHLFPLAASLAGATVSKWKPTKQSERNVPGLCWRVH